MTPTQKAQSVDRLASQRSSYTGLGEGYTFGVVSRPESPEGMTLDEIIAQTVWGITFWDTAKLGAEPTEAELDAAEINFLKSAKIKELAAARYEAEVAGVTVAPFGTIPTDRTTQAKLTAVYIKALNDPTYTKNWKVGLATWATLDAATILSIGDAMEAHIQEQFDHEQLVTEAVLAATTEEAISAINW